jgi:hypothetical protein
MQPEVQPGVMRAQKRDKSSDHVDQKFIPSVKSILLGVFNWNW